MILKGIGDKWEIYDVVHMGWQEINHPPSVRDEGFSLGVHLIKG